MASSTYKVSADSVSIVSDVVEKNYDASTWRRMRRRRKNEESRRTFNKNSCDLLTAI